LHTHIKNMSTE